MKPFTFVSKSGNEAHEVTFTPCDASQRPDCKRVRRIDGATIAESVVSYPDAMSAYAWHCAEGWTLKPLA